MATFPNIATTKTVGPNTVVVLVLKRGETRNPLQIVDLNEAGVAEVTLEGSLRMTAGQFWVREPSILAEISV